jgi:hypothetical protein
VLPLLPPLSIVRIVLFNVLCRFSLLETRRLPPYFANYTKNLNSYLYNKDIYQNLFISSKVLREYFYICYILTDQFSTKKLNDYFLALGLFVWALFNNNHSKKNR